MINNKTIGQQLNLISKLLELHGESSFRAKAYSQAAFKIEQLPYELSLEKLNTEEIPGIGTSLKETIIEILEEKPTSTLYDLLNKTPEGLIEMMNIKGLGPKKIRTIWLELEIDTIGELAYACEENRLTSIKGFGAKTQANILENIRFLEQQKGWYLFADAWNLYQDLKSHIPDFEKSWFPIGDFALQKDTLQKMEFIGYGDLGNLEKPLQSLFPDTELFKTTEEISIKPATQVQLSFQFTSKDQLGLTLLEKSSTLDWWSSFHTQYSLPLSASTEQEVWAHLGIKPIPAYLRNNSLQESIQIVDSKNDIIQSSHIKGIIHAHSTYSDGLSSLKEMALHTKSLGYEYLVISDHSQSAFYANGLKIDRVQQQHLEIDQLNEELAPFKIFKSIESDILYDGSLDYTDEELRNFDLVIASVHSQLRMTEEKATERLLKAIEHPATRILGHPTGRLLLSRPGYPLDIEKILAHCLLHNVVVEINAHPRRLDLDWTWVKKAQDMGVMLSINPDAHSVEGVSLIEFGILSAQKAGLRSKNNLSSMSLIAFENYLQSFKSPI